MEPTTSPADSWHLDKKVPLALIMAIVIQTLGAVWWAASMQTRMDSMQAQIQASRGYDERLIRVEEALKSTNVLMDRLSKQLDQLEADRRHPEK